MATSNLYEYYKSIGQPLPSLAERQSIAAQAGIPNYAGTADQNAMLLSFLVKQPSPSASVLKPGITTDLSQIPVGVPTPPVSNELAVPPPLPTPQFVSPRALTYEETLVNQKSTLQDEISALEAKMANRKAAQNTLYETAGIFEDTRKLNELKAKKRALEDRAIEIPLETRADLRRVGGATIADFTQMTRPAIEENLLKTLAATRETTALSETIQTNLAIADSYLKAENDRQDLIYKQKNEQLTNVQKLYGDIMTEKQKMAVEERKFTNDLFLVNFKNQNDIKMKYIDLLKDQNLTPQQLQALLTGDIDTVINTYSNITNQPNPQIIAGTDATLANIEKLLSNEKGLEASVGVGLGNTILGSVLGGAAAAGGLGAAGGSFFGPLGTAIGGIGGAIVGGTAKGISTSGAANQFRSDLQSLFSKETLEYYASVKARGVTFGALSEGELQLLQDAASGGFGLKKDDKGAFTGQSNLTEESFKKNLQDLQKAVMKVNIAEIQRGNFDPNKWRDASYQDVLNVYSELKAQQIKGAGPTPYEQDLSGKPVTRAGGNLPQRNNNPGNVKRGGLADDLAVGTDPQGHLIFPTPQAGFEALTRDVYAKISGNSRYLPPNPTIAQMGKVYAEDPNWPISVARILGVSPNTATSTIPLDKLVAAIARQEGYFAT